MGHTVYLLQTWLFAQNASEAGAYAWGVTGVEGHSRLGQVFCCFFFFLFYLFGHVMYEDTPIPLPSVWIIFFFMASGVQTGQRSLNLG